MAYKVTIHLKCKKCLQEFDEETKSVMCVTDAIAYMGFSYNHTCYDNPHDKIVLGKADVLGMTVDFKESE